MLHGNLVLCFFTTRTSCGVVAQERNSGRREILVVGREFEA